MAHTVKIDIDPDHPSGRRADPATRRQSASRDLWIPVAYQSLSAEVQNRLDHMNTERDGQPSPPSDGAGAPVKDEDEAYRTVAQLAQRRKSTYDFYHNISGGGDKVTKEQKVAVPSLAVPPLDRPSARRPSVNVAARRESVAKDLWIPVAYQSLSAEVQNRLDRMNAERDSQLTPAGDKDEGYQTVAQLSQRRKSCYDFYHNKEALPSLPTPAMQQKRQSIGFTDGAAVIDVTKEATIDDHLVPLDVLEKRYDTNMTRGLDEKQVRARRSKYGKNVLSPPKQPSAILQFIKCIVGGFAVVLWVAFFLCIIAYKPLGDPPEIYTLILGIVILIVIIIQGLFFFLEERKSSSLMKSFSNFLPTLCQVKRNGQLMNEDATELVTGDIVMVKAGDKIPADMRLIESNQAKVEKSGLTGESEPIALSTTTFDPNIYETRNVALFGTSMLEGTATGMVINTGDRMVMGKIARLASGTSSAMTSLQREINYTTGLIATMAVVLILVVVLGYYYGIDPYHPGYLPPAVVCTTCIGCVVSLLPDGMPVALAAILSLTAKRMHKIKILVKKLTVLETLGSTTLVASDKTGTLTQNRMTLKHVWIANDNQSDQSLPEDEKSKKALTEKLKELDTLEKSIRGCYAARSISSNLSDPVMTYLCQVMCLCNKTVFDEDDEPSPTRSNGPRKFIGNPTEGALLIAADEFVNVPQLRRGAPIVGEIAFTSRTKYHLTVHHVAEQQLFQNSLCAVRSASDKAFVHVIFVKGAPEYVLGMCTKTVVNGVEVNMEPSLVSHVMNSNETMASHGERVLAFAYRKLSAHEFPEDFEFDMDEEEQWTEALTFLGLAGVIDPPREGVAESIVQCHGAHVRVMMVTGDQPSTAVAIARMVNIVTNKEVKTMANVHRDAPYTADDELVAAEENACLSKLKNFFKSPPKRQFIDESIVVAGTDIGELSQKQWDYVLRHREVVFARTTPQQKLEIVEESRKRGDVVAVTGDGVNDAPALKAANLGVAMGICGSDVSKEAANMILLDDNFVTIVNGIKEGRLLFDNLKKLICYLFPSGSFSEILPVLAGVFLGVPLPLSAFDMIVICVGTDMTGSLGMIHEQAESDIMHRPPRNARTDRLVNLKIILFSYFFIGVMESSIGFFMYFFTMWMAGVYPSQLLFAFDKWETEGWVPHLSPAQQRELIFTGQTAFLVALVMCQLWNLLASRTRYQSILTQKFQKQLVLYMAGEVLIVLFVIYLPAVQENMHTKPLEFYHFLIPLAMGSIILIADEIRKFFVRRYPKGILARLAW